MADNPLVSVIVAAYNAEQYIRRCLDSLLAQTMTDFELIVVDDGSTDGTSAILDEYAAADSRIRVIHKPNGGVASARQAGMDAAAGEYTIHADADDWVAPEMLEELCAKAREEDADMVICDFMVIFPKGDVQTWRQQPESLDTVQVLGDMMANLHGSLCNKLIRRSCYTNYHIRFREDVTVCEDQMVVLSVLSHPVKVAYLNKPFYYYDRTQNAGSLVNSELPIAKRLLPLEIIARETDISPVQQKFDNAVFVIAYYALFVPAEYCPDYLALFRKHRASLKRAQMPFRSKLLVFLRLSGIKLPARALKKLFKR